MNFSLPQTSLGAISIGDMVKVKLEANEKDFEGRVSAINPQIDPSTRNVGVQATVVNENEQLRPGMYAQVEVVSPHEEKFLTLPSSSISYAPYGNSVFIVDKLKNAAGAEFVGVRQQIVNLGKKRGDQVAVLSGLSPGMEVVTSGTFKLRPNDPVVVNNTVTPGNEISPKPADT